MHRITKFDIKSQCCKYVDDRIIQIINEKIVAYNSNPTPDNYLAILYNVPSGFELTARLTTDYRCLLNIYIQRHDHRLPEWREFCEYIRWNLPYFNELIEAYKGEEFENVFSVKP